MGTRRRFLQKDIEIAMDRFPKLKPVYFDKETWLKGTIDICDTEGNYWDSFEVKIIIHYCYPYDIPTVIELGEKIPREDDRHVSESGECCLDIMHNLIIMAKRGIKLADFIKEMVYPFFANQLYFEKEGEYADGEWKHHDDGVLQFYKSELNIEDYQLAKSILNSILHNRLPSRNEPCICKQKKFKKCHYESVQFLKDLGRYRLQEDLKIFEAIKI